MMFRSNRLTLITVVYWVLLVYVVAALVFWFISLTRQNDSMAVLLLNELKKDDVSYTQKADRILNAKDRKTTQYILEGATFLALILLGAVFVYRATRRQIKLSQQQQNFMMAVTHELKTPIAIAQLNLETLQKRKLDETQQQKLIANTLQEANRLNTLCNNILLASQLDAGAYTIARTNICLSEVVQAAVEAFRVRFAQRTIVSHIAPELYLQGELLLLQMLVNNLLDNAHKYSPKDQPVTVRLRRETNKLILQVADQGPGVPAEEKQKVFEKFYRVGSETTRTAKGSGLGLYLCQRIASDHSGSIGLTDNKPTGSIFTVAFNVHAYAERE